MSVQIIGVSSEGSDENVAADYLSASIFAASASGNIDEFRIHMHGTSNVKAAIYANNAGDIGTQLWVNNTGQSCSAGWNTFTVSPGVAVVSGTSYWLAFNIDTQYTVHYVAGGGTTPVNYRYKSANYTTVGCPSDGSGTSTYAHVLSLQGWKNPVAYSFDCSPGSHVITGNVSTPLAARMINLGTQAYSVAGAGITVIRTLLFNAGAGSHAITGTNLTPLASRILNAFPGAHTITGQDASLLVARMLSVNPGAITIVGSNASLVRALLLNAGPGTYNLTGFDADATIGELVDFLLNAASGTYAITGANAGLLGARLLSAGSGSSVISGSDARLTSSQSKSQSKVLMKIDVGENIMILF